MLNRTLSVQQASEINQVLCRFKTGLAMKDQNLYANALEVRSYENERMEYLGDAVIGLMAAHDLFLEHPTADEGKLSRLRVEIVKGSALSALCVSSGVSNLLPDTVSHNLTSKVLEDSIESFVAAIFLDHGLDVCNDWFRNAVKNLTNTPKNNTSIEKKSDRDHVRKFCKSFDKSLAVKTRKSQNGWDSTILIQGLIAGKGHDSKNPRCAETCAFKAAKEYIDMVTTSDRDAIQIGKHRAH